MPDVELVARSDRRIRRTLISVVVAGFLVVYVALGLSTEFQFVGTHGLPGALLEDFKFYLRAYVDATQGRDPYAIRNIGPAFLYPPPALFIVGLFARFTMPLETAAAYIAVNLALLAVLVWGVARRFGYGIDRVWWWFPLAFGFAPVLEDLHLGQINLVTEFGTFLLFAFDTTVPVLAGFGLALAGLTKVTPFLFLVYLVGTRNRPTLLASSGWIVGGLAASGLAFGWRHLITFVDVFRGLSGGFLPGDGNAQGLLSILDYNRLINPAQATGDQQLLNAFFAVVVALSVVLGALFHQKQQFFLVVALVATLSPNIMWYHHWVFLLLPVFVWMAASGFRPGVVVWCVAGLTVIQVDRFGLSHGLAAQAFAYLSLGAILAWQALDARRCLSTAVGLESVAREIGEVRLVVGQIFQRFTESAEQPEGTPPAKGPSAPPYHLAASILVFGAIVLGAWLRVHAALDAGEVADVAAYRNHVEALRLGQSVYHQGAVYPYFPGWLQLEWLSWQASGFARVPFWLTIRLLIVSADVLTCFALWWAGTRLLGSGRGRWAAAIYALNPIAILVSGYHGQFEAVPTLLSVVAVGLMAYGRPPGVVGLLLGAAIAVKPYPAAVVPVFLRANMLTLRQRLILGAAIVATVGLVVVAFAGADSLQVIRSVAGYGGVSDQGVGGLLRSVWMYRTNNASLPGDFVPGRDTRWLTTASMALTLLLTWRYSIARSSAALLLAFLVSYGAVSTQYLVWPLAWLLLSDVSPGWSVLYGIGVACGAAGFYLQYWPQILFGAAYHAGQTTSYALAYAEGEVVGWVIIVGVYLVTIGRPRAAGRWWRPAVAIASIAVLVTTFPFAAQVTWLAGQMIQWHG